MEFVFTVIVSIALLIGAVIEGNKILKSNFDRIHLDAFSKNESEEK